MSASPEHHHERPLVAVVDDDRDVREFLARALGSAGYDVTEAQNGLRLVSALEVDRPALILLDVMMSWIDGIELCRALKRNPRYRSIPVVFISGRADRATVDQGLEAGAADYFAKPLDVQALLDRVRELVQPAA